MNKKTVGGVGVLERISPPETVDNPYIKHLGSLLARLNRLSTPQTPEILQEKTALQYLLDAIKNQQTAERVRCVQSLITNKLELWIKPSAEDIAQGHKDVAEIALNKILTNNPSFNEKKLMVISDLLRDITINIGLFGNHINLLYMNSSVSNITPEEKDKIKDKVWRYIKQFREKGECFGVYYSRPDEPNFGLIDAKLLQAKLKEFRFLKSAEFSQLINEYKEALKMLKKIQGYFMQVEEICKNGFHKLLGEITVQIVSLEMLLTNTN